MLQNIKLSLRLSNDVFDEEIQSLIDAAKLDLQGGGVAVSKTEAPDPLIRRAITLYVMANFGMANPDSVKYDEAYHNLRQKLSLNSKYNVLE